jgi:pyruvate/2-oxoglutarate dehydrogenase complex dihydrolipoamide acyltransferase (E2) component
MLPGAAYVEQLYEVWKRDKAALAAKARERKLTLADKKRPVAVGDQVEVRPMMYLALSYDHRIIDGKDAVSFLKRIVECIEEPDRLLLEV